MVEVGDSLVDEFGKLADQGGFTYTKFTEASKPQKNVVIESIMILLCGHISW
jgi:hypothetical protein